MRVYNNREGLTAADDDLPARFFDESVPSGIHAGRRFDREKFRYAKEHGRFLDCDRNVRVFIHP